MYNEELDLVNRLENNGTAVVLRPEQDVNVGRMERNPEKLQRLYEAGFVDGKKALSEFLYNE